MEIMAVISDSNNKNTIIEYIYKYNLKGKNNKWAI